jgi:hypothetical protein
MLWNRARSLPDLCTDLANATMRLDEKASTKAFHAVAQRAGKSTPAELTDAATRLIPALQTVAIGNGGPLAGLTAGLIETGADPLPLLKVLVHRISHGFEQAARFPALADKVGGTLNPPANAAEASVLLTRVTTAAAAAGLSAEDAASITQAWFTINDWIPALLLPLQQQRARRALPERRRLTDAAAAVSEHVEDASWLLGLLKVLDDEQLIVIHRATNRVYEVSISGIGDNFQLHTLLAATLIGDEAEGLIPGERPLPAWIAAATDGEMTPSGGIRGQFNLVDATGAWIWNEGRPADIPITIGRRIIILDQPPYQRSWNIGRAYPLMRPHTRLDRILTHGDSAAWLERIAPARPSG